jgi:quinohemoprotein ethanol dehydrogenase
MVFLGNSEGDEGIERSYVDAFDATTGRHVWRFHTVPGNAANGRERPAMELAARTWAPGSTPAGGAVWSGMLYDQKLKRLYFGVGNPEPHERGWKQLFGNSIVAVDARSGKLIWYFQEVPGGIPYDCDAVAEMHLAELPTGEGVRRVVMQASKDGFFYVLDAQTGRFLSANNYVPDNWASGVDASGSLVFRTPDRQGDLTIVQPGGMGAHTWTYGAYNPQTRIVYIPGWIWPYSYAAENGNAEGDTFYGLSANASIKSVGRLIAWDPIAQTERWHVDQRLPLNGGVLATGGNLVFQGMAEGTFNAYAADSGKQLWSFDAHGTIHAPPITVELDGKQMILVPSGDGAATGTGLAWPKMTTTPEAQGRSRLLAFELGGSGTVAPTPVRTIPRPFRPLQPAALAQRGAQLYQDSHCTRCHGWEAEKGGLRIPDLRTISSDVYDEMPNIVIHGALVQAGMPIFPKLTPDDITAIQAYLTNQAWAGYDRQQRN